MYIQEEKENLKNRIVAEMKAAYLTGTPSTFIAKQNGISPKTFYRWLNLSPEEKAEHNSKYWLLNSRRKEI